MLSDQDVSFSSCLHTPKVDQTPQPPGLTLGSQPIISPDPGAESSSSSAPFLHVPGQVQPDWGIQCGGAAEQPAEQPVGRACVGQLPVLPAQLPGSSLRALRDGQTSEPPTQTTHMLLAVI